MKALGCSRKEAVISLLLVFLAFAWLGTCLPPGDLDVLLDGAQAIACGESLYDVRGFYSPPWVAVLLIPLSFVPRVFARALWAGLSGVCLLLSAYAIGRGKGRRVAIGVAFALASVPVVFCVIWLNLDVVLLAVALFLPAGAAIPLLLMKPQVGVGLVAYYIWQVIRGERPARELIPGGCVVALSFAFFGFWPAHSARAATSNLTWNASLWGISEAAVFGGLWLFFEGVKDRDTQLAFVSGPFMSPYVGLPSWAGLVMVAAGKWPIVAVVLSVVSWAVKFSQV